MKNFTLIPVCILLIPRCIRANQRERAIKVCVSPLELRMCVLLVYEIPRILEV